MQMECSSYSIQTLVSAPGGPVWIQLVLYAACSGQPSPRGQTRKCSRDPAVAPRKGRPASAGLWGGVAEGESTTERWGTHSVLTFSSLNKSHWGAAPAPGLRMRRQQRWDASSRGVTHSAHPPAPPPLQHVRHVVPRARRRPHVRDDADEAVRPGRGSEAGRRAASVCGSRRRGGATGSGDCGRERLVCVREEPVCGPLRVSRRRSEGVLGAIARETHVLRACKGGVDGLRCGRRCPRVLGVASP